MKQNLLAMPGVTKNHFYLKEDKVKNILSTYMAILLMRLSKIIFPIFCQYKRSEFQRFLKSLEAKFGGNH